MFIIYPSVYLKFDNDFNSLKYYPVFRRFSSGQREKVSGKFEENKRESVGERERENFLSSVLLLLLFDVAACCCCFFVGVLTPPLLSMAFVVSFSLKIGQNFVGIFGGGRIVGAQFAQFFYYYEFRNYFINFIRLFNIKKNVSKCCELTRINNFICELNLILIPKSII